jgi:hypothetical protein
MVGSTISELAQMAYQHEYFVLYDHSSIQMHRVIAWTHGELMRHSIGLPQYHNFKNLAESKTW